MRKIPYYLLTSIMLLGCAIPTFLTPLSGANSEDCSNIEITDTDVEKNLAYGASMFSDWKRSYTVQQDQTYAFYLNNPLGAAASVTTLALCDARNELKSYANPGNLDILLSNYDEFKQTASCEQDGTLLFQFTAYNDDFKYDIHFWFEPLKERNRAREVMVVFPVSDLQSMEKYSTTLFPDIPFCP